MTTPRDLLVEIDMLRRVMARGLRGKRDIGDQLGRIARLRQRITVAAYHTELEIAGQLKTVAEWRVWAKELRRQLEFSPPDADWGEDETDLLEAIELKLRLSETIVDIEACEAELDGQRTGEVR